jgi:hypothetical protein
VFPTRQPSRSRTARLALALGLLSALALPTGAGAATVSVSDDPVSHYARFALRAEPGEANDLQVSARAAVDGVVVVSDAVSPITPGQGCVAVDQRTVRCQGPPGEFLAASELDLGDGDDSLVMSEEASSPDLEPTLRGGPGNDHLRLTTNNVRSKLDGGPGDDVLEVASEQGSDLSGGGGRDELHGGRGPDTLRDGDTEGHADGDVLDGGGGLNGVSYRNRQRPLRIDIPRGRAGEAGELDSIAHVQLVVAGRNDDVLIGGSGGEELHGGGGADAISAGAGADRVFVDGRDRVSAGRGNDSVLIYHGGLASIDCGLGRDEVDELEAQRAGPRLDLDCERLEGDSPAVEDPNPFTVRVAPLRSTRDGRLTFGVECIFECRGRTIITRPTAPFRRVATGRRFSLPTAQGRVSVRLPRAVARRAGRRPVWLRMALRGPDGTTVWQIAVRLPR